MLSLHPQPSRQTDQLEFENADLRRRPETIDELVASPSTVAMPLVIDRGERSPSVRAQLESIRRFRKSPSGVQALTRMSALEHEFVAAETAATGLKAAQREPADTEELEDFFGPRHLEGVATDPINPVVKN